MQTSKPVTLLEFYRGELVEQFHSGFIIHGILTIF